MLTLLALLQTIEEQASNYCTGFAMQSEMQCKNALERRTVAYQQSQQ